MGNGERVYADDGVDVFPIVNAVAYGPCKLEQVVDEERDEVHGPFRYA